MTSLRSRLFHGTAVAALAFLPNAVQAAAILPNLGIVGAGTVAATGTNATVVGGGTFGAGALPIVVTSVANNGALNLTVGAGAGAAGQSAVVNWDSFSIGSTGGTNNVVTFKGAGDFSFSVLNRVTNAANPTTIAGTLQGNSAAAAGSRGTIFVVNEAGISFANSATVTNLTGFVASSLGVTDGEFAKFATGTTQFTGTGANSIAVAADGATQATITPDSVLLLVAPKLDIQGGVLSAAGGDAGFVLASDATVALNSASIISIKIDAGATVSTAQTLAGTIGGKRVLVAAATSADLVGTLLNVTGDLTATTATATDKGIVIAIGRNAPIDATNSIIFTAPDPIGPPIVAGAQFVGGLNVIGTLTSSTSVNTVASGALALGGNVSSVGDLTGSGTSIVLGTAALSKTFAAGGQVGLTATTGSITAAGASLITSNKAGAAAVGAGDITLTAATAIGDTTNPGFISTTGGTLADPRAVNITVGAGSDLHLGAITALKLISTGDVTGTLTTTGAITLGATTVTNDLNVGTTGSVAIASASAANIAVTATGTATLPGAVTATGNYTVKGASVSLGGTGITQTAVGDVLVQSTTGNIAGAGTLIAGNTGAAHRLVLDSATSIDGVGGIALNLTAGPARQSDVLLRVGTASNLTLGSIAANQLSGATLIALPLGTVADYLPTINLVTTVPTLATGGAITLGAVKTTTSNAIQSTGTATIGGDTSTSGSVEISATTGDVTLSGAVSAATTASLHADLGTLTAGSVSAFGGDATLKGTTAIVKAAGAQVIAASGSVALKSDGAIGVDALRAGGTIIAGGSTGTNAASLTGDSLRAGGAVTVNTSGLITLTGLASTAISAESTGQVLNAGLTAFTGPLGAVAAADVTLASTGGAVAVNDVASTRNIIGSGTTFTLGKASETHSLAAEAGAGTVTLTASDTGASAITVLGDYTISGGGAVALQRSAGVGANVVHDDTLAITGQNVLVGDIALAATPSTLFGTGNVTLTANGGAATDSVVAGVVTARNAVAATSINGAVTLGGATSGLSGDIFITAAKNAAVTGAVSSAGNYTVIGNNVALGDVAVPTQSAVGDVLIRATANIFASGTLVADSVGAGSRRLVLAGNAIFTNGGGNVNLRAGAGAIATAANRSDVLVALDPTKNLALGTVDADVFSGATGPANATLVGQYMPTVSGTTPTLITSGAISTGAIQTIQSLIIGSTGAAAAVTLGGVTSVAGSVEAYSTTGDLALTGPVSAKTFANLHADAGTLTVGDVRAFGGNATLVGATAIALASGGSHVIAALNNVVLQSPMRITIDAVRAGGTATVRGSIVSGSSAASLTGTSIAANGDISISTTADINLTGSGLTIDAPRQAINANLSVFDGGPVGNADIALTSTAGAVTVGAIEATGKIFITAFTTATVSGNAEAGFSSGSGDYVVKGATVSLGGTGTVQKASGNVWIVASGTSGIGAAGTLIANDTGAAGSRLVLDSAGPISGGANLQSGFGVGPTALNRSDILIALGNASQPVTLGNIDANSLSLAASGAASVAAYVPVVANQFETKGAVTFGAISTVVSNVIGSTGIIVGSQDVSVGGDTSITGSVEIRSAAGAVTASGPVLAATFANLHADAGTLTVGDVGAFGGNATLIGKTAIAKASGSHAIVASVNVGLSSDGAIGVDAIRAGGTIAAGGATMTNATMLTGDSLQANGAITVATSGDIMLGGMLGGIHAMSIATRRTLIDTSLAGFGGMPTAPDANIALTTVAGTISVNGGSSTGNTMLTAGTGGVSGGVNAAGTLAAGDVTTAAGTGDIVLNGFGATSLANGIATHKISVTSNADNATIGTATAGTAAAGGTITAQSLATGGRATITSGTTTLGDVKALANVAGGIALITTGQATLGNVLASGDASATVANGTTLGAVATGDVTATSASGTATIGTANARGNVTATAATLADITSGTAVNGSVVASGGTAHIGFGGAAINVRALASGGTATVDTGTAATGNVDALASTDATITSGTATLGNVRATSTGGGIAKIATGIAGASVVATGGTVTIGSATAGDDIIASSTGSVIATTLTVTGLGTDTAATDASGTLLTGALTGLGGSNAIIRAGTTATIGGVVSIVQANAAQTANYDVKAASVVLGTTGVALDQGAAGRVDLVTTGGAVTFANTGGTLQSNVGGTRTANALADATTAGGGLSITSATSITGATTTLVANAKTLGGGFDTQARQPGVVLAAAAGGGGSVQLASITGGAVTVTAPATIAIPTIIATGNVSLTGVAVSGNDTATVSPTTITIDGLNAGYARVNVTARAGAGAEVASLGVVRGGLVDALQIVTNTGAATLRATPTDPTMINSILVESQTGTAGILNPLTVAAQSIVLRGRQAGSIARATGPLLATGSVLATGDVVSLGTVTVGGTIADGPGDILIAATTSASLAAGATETAVARRTINVTGGTALLGDGTATGGTLAVSGTGVTVTRRAVAGDDVILTSLGALTATSATITTTGAVDLQAGDDTAPISVVSIGGIAGTGYGAGHTVGTDVLVTDIDAVTGGNLTRLAGTNIIVTAIGNIDLGAATVTAAPGALQRDVHIEAGGTLSLAGVTAARELIVSSVGTLVATGTLTAGDDLAIGSSGTVDLHGATLRTVGSASGQTDARLADGSLVNLAAAGGPFTNLGGSNIAIGAAGAIQLGAVSTTGATPSSLRVFSNAGITTTQAIGTTGSIALVGATVASPFALTAGDDIVAVARGGTATLGGILTTTGVNASNAALVDLAGNGIALPGEAALGRVDGSSILVAATGLATVSTAVTSAGRYSVYGRGGIALGTAAAVPPGTAQSAARDVLLEASIGATPPAASISLANNMVLTANSDGVETASGSGFIPDPLVIRLGNGSLNAAGATLRALRTPTALLADQGTVQIQPVVTDGVKSITIATLDSASADLRALNNVTVTTANVDAGLTLASKAGAVSLATLTVGTGTPLMTPTQVAAIDLKLFGATGATLGNAVTGANQLRDITVATSGGPASITGAAGARDDIVVASTTGAASAGILSFVGTVADSEVGVATIAATDANGVALADPYQVSGPTITGLAGRNIVVSGATGATLATVITAANDSLGDVRVVTASGPATLTTVSTGGAGLPSRVIVATRNGTATGTTLNASGDIIVDATLGSATLTTGNAGRDGIVVGPSVSIGNLTVGDDIVAVATAGTLTAGTLTSTGANSGDAIATIFRADGSAIADPVAGGVVGGLLGGNVIALASSDVTVTTATAPGLVRIASKTGTATVTGATTTAGDLLITGATVNATTLSAGRDATVTATGLATIARLTAGRDVTINAGSATLGSGAGLIAAQRNFLATTSGALTIGTARAGGTLTAIGGSVMATTLGAGDALTVRAIAGDATVTTASSTGRPLLADFSGFATTGSAAGSTRDITVSATGMATLTTGTAVHSIGVAGTTATATTANGNTGGTDGDLTVSGTSGGATLGLGSARDIRVVATGGGAASATTATASRDLYVDASGGTATLTTGVAGRDGIVVGPSVSIGSLTAADDIVAVANAGTLIATTLSSTGANSGDGITTIARANGSSISDPVAGGSVGGLSGGNVVALGSGNVTVTSATATAAAGATVPGLVRLASLGGTTTVTTATASAGDIVLAGVGVSGGTVTAGRDATLTSTGGDIGLGIISTGRDLVLNSANDIVVGGLSNAGGNATLTAVRDINLGATAAGDALDAAGYATLTAGRDIVVAQRTMTGAALTATATGGMATIAGTNSGTTTTIATLGNLTLTADAAATGALALMSAAGAITAPNISGNGITLTAANSATVTGTVNSTGVLTATGGSLSFGSIANATEAVLHATGAIGVTGATVISGALTATSDAGAIGMGAVTTGGPATITAADATNGAILLASLTTTGAATLRAGQSAAVTGAATTSGAITATSTNGSLRFGSIAAGGTATLRARTTLTVDGLARSTGGALDALSSAGALSFGSTQAATTVALRGATGITVTSGTTAGGAATITADTGPVTTGDINAGGDTVVTASNGSATLASVSKTGKLTVTAATDATISGALTTTGDTLITATNGSATIGGAVKTANYTVKANNGTIALGTGVVQASSGTVTLDSQRLTIGVGTTLVAPTRIQLDVTGNAAGVALGDGSGAAADTTKYVLSKAGLQTFQTPVFEIAAGARSVDIGIVDLGDGTAVGGLAGITSGFGIRTTGDIRIADQLTFKSAAALAAPRVLTLGGAAGGADLDKTTTTANAIKVLAVPGLDNSVTGTGGQINAAGSIVQLRATYIALGEKAKASATERPFIAALLPPDVAAPLTTADVRTNYLNNASSTLYVAIPPYTKQAPAPQALVKAGTLVLAPGQWALIQNTGPTTTPGGGIEVGTLKLNKVAGAAAADPVIGVFGSVAGKTGVASAISVSATNLDGISPNNIRVNGCVALSTAGCIQSAVAVPLINLADPGRTLLISSAPDLALSVELITGATNEALWREDDDDCAAGVEKDRCGVQPGQKSPQRESRP